MLAAISTRKIQKSGDGLEQSIRLSVATARGFGVIEECATFLRQLQLPIFALGRKKAKLPTVNRKFLQQCTLKIVVHNFQGCF